MLYAEIGRSNTCNGPAFGLEVTPRLVSLKPVLNCKRNATSFHLLVASCCFQGLSLPHHCEPCSEGGQGASPCPAAFVQSAFHQGKFGAEGLVDFGMSGHAPSATLALV